MPTGRPATHSALSQGNQMLCTLLLTILIIKAGQEMHLPIVVTPTCEPPTHSALTDHVQYVFLGSLPLGVPAGPIVAGATAVV